MVASWEFPMSPSLWLSPSCLSLCQLRTFGMTLGPPRSPRITSPTGGQLTGNVNPMLIPSCLEKEHIHRFWGLGPGHLFVGRMVFLYAASPNRSRLPPPPGVHPCLSRRELWLTQVHQGCPGGLKPRWLLPTPELLIQYFSV